MFRWGPVLVLLLLGQSLTGSPGVTGAIPYGTFAVNAMALLAVAALVCYRGKFIFTRLTIATLGLIVGSAISLTRSPAVYLSQVGFASLSGFSACLILLEHGVRSRDEWRKAANAMVLLISLSSLYGLYLWRQQLQNHPLSSNFTNPDCYSAILLIGFFLALGLALEQKLPAKAFSLAALFPLTSALLLTASRAGLLGLLVGYLGFVFTLFSSRSSKLRSSALKLISLPLLITILLSGLGSSLPMVEKLRRLSLGNDPVSIQSRKEVVLHGGWTFLRHPWTGSGLGCFSLAYQQNRTALSSGEDYMNVAHNDYVQWAIETGALGFLSWTALLVFGIERSWRSYQCPTPWVAGQVGAVLGVSSYCLFNFACPVAADFLWIGATLGMSGALFQISGQRTESTWSPKFFPLALLVGAWSLWTGNFAWNLRTTEVIQQRADQMAGDLDWEGAVTALSQAAQRQPLDEKIALREAEQAHKAFLFSGDATWLASEERALERAHRASPTSLTVLARVIGFLQQAQRPDEAQTYVDSLSIQAPYSPIARKLKAYNQILLGKTKEAIASLAEIEKTGQEADDVTLAGLLFHIEAKQPQGSLDFLRRIASQQPDRAANLGIRMVEESQRTHQPEAAIRVLSTLRYLADQRVDLVLALAKLRGEAGDEAGRLRLLDNLRKDENRQIAPETLEEIWRQWSELQVKQGKLDLVVAQLDDYLLSHKKQIWPRVTIASIYLKRDQRAEARSVLREGVPYDLDGSLRLQLGDLCAQQQLWDLARSYYQEALPLVSDKTMVEEKLKALRGKSDDPEIE